MQAVKKLKSHPKNCFKITFLKDGLIKGDVNRDSKEQHSKDPKGEARLDRWYLSIDQDAHGEPSAIDWICMLTIHCMEINSNFEPDASLHKLLENDERLTFLFNRAYESRQKSGGSPRETS